MYNLNDNTVADPTGGTFAIPISGTNASDGWTLNVPSLTIDGDIVYVTTRTFTDDASSPQDPSWSATSIYATRVDGVIGLTGQAVRHVNMYNLNDNTVADTAGGTFNTPISGTNASDGWTLNVPSLALDGDIVYVTTRTFTNDAGSPQDPAWSATSIYAQRTDGATGATGATGADGSVGWGHDLIFSVGSSPDDPALVVQWTSGTIWTAAGLTFPIDAGDTGVMSARTFIYFNGASPIPTTMSLTTSAVTSVGLDKILVAVAENTTTEAFFQVFGGRGGLKIAGDEIAANSIIANNVNASFFTGRTFQTRALLSEQTSPFSTNPRASMHEGGFTLQDAEDNSVFEADATDGHLIVGGTSDINNISATSIQGWAQSAIDAIADRLGTVGPTNPTGGSFTFASLPLDIPGTSDATITGDTPTSGVLSHKGGETVSLSCRVYDATFGFFSTNQNFVSPSYDVQFRRAVSPYTVWGDIGAPQTVTGTSLNVFDQEIAKWECSFRINTTALMTDVTGVDATDYKYRAVVSYNSGSFSAISRITAFTYAEPIFGDAAEGNVSNTGTPLDNQIAIWTNSTTIEGVTNLTYDGTDFDVNANLFIGGDAIGHFETVSGVEGSVQADGKEGSTGFFAGYAVGNRSGFFDNVGTLTTNQIAVYDQLNAQYVLRYNGDASSHRVALYNDGTLKFQTLTTGVLVVGDVGASTFSGVALTTAGAATNFLDETGAYSVPGGTGGTVTTVSVVSANGISGTVATATTTPAITLALDDITPESIVITPASPQNFTEISSSIGTFFIRPANGILSVSKSGTQSRVRAYGPTAGGFLYTSITHNDTDGWVESNTGVLNVVGDSDVVIRTQGNEPTITCTSGGAVTIKHNVSAKFATTSTGVAITGGLTTTTTVAATGNVTGANLSGSNTGDNAGVTAVTGGTGVDSTGGNTPDITLDVAELAVGGTLLATDHLIAANAAVSNKQLISSIPLSIFNDDIGAGGGGTVGGTGTDNFLAVWNGTANIDAGDSFLVTNAVDKSAVEAIAGAWSFSGLNTVTGGSLRFNDGVDCIFGTTSDVAINFNGVTTFDIQMISGVDFLLRGGSAGSKPMIDASSNSHVALYWNGSVKFITQTTGVGITGTLAATTVTGANVTTGADPGHTHTTASITGLSGTNTGDNAGVTSVTGGVGIDSTGGTTPSITLDVSELGLGGTLLATDHLVAANASVSNRQVISSIPLSIFNNNSGWTSNTGTVTSVTGGTGVDSTGGTTPSITLDVNELAVGGTLLATDHLIAANSTVSNKQLISSIPLSIFNDDIGAGGAFLPLAGGALTGATSISAQFTVLPQNLIMLDADATTLRSYIATKDVAGVERKILVRGSSLDRINISNVNFDTNIQYKTLLMFNGSENLTIGGDLNIGGDATGHFETVSGIEGSVQADGKEGSTGFFAGYSVGNRSGFYDNAGTLTTNQIGIYDQLNTQYVLRYNGDASSHRVALYNDGTLKFQTLTTGVLVVGDVGATTFNGGTLSGSNTGDNTVNTSVNLSDYSGDADSATTRGNRRVNSTATNMPTASTFWSMMTYGNGSNVAAQLATHFTTGDTYVRAFNTVWSSWTQLGSGSVAFNDLTSKTSGTGNYTTTGDFTADNFEATGLGPNSTPGTDDSYFGGYGVLGSRASTTYVSNVAGAVSLNHTGIHGTNIKLATTTTGVAITGGITVTSTTLVTNLNADRLDSVHGSSFLRSDAADQKTSGNLRFNDNIQLNFGNGDDVDMYFSGVDFFIDMPATTSDFRVRGGTGGTEVMFAGIANGQAIMYYNGLPGIQTQSHTATGNTSGGTVTDHENSPRDLGFNDVKVTDNNPASVTLAANQCGSSIVMDDNTAFTVTLPASTGLDFPVGGMTILINANTSAVNMTIVDTASATCYYMSGTARTDIAGTATLGPGGVATIYRQEAAIFLIWGTGITP